jgi:hypothetical protein
MKTLKYLAGAVALALSVPTFATPISDDGMGAGGAGLGSGTGNGDFFLTVEDSVRNQTFILNLGGNVLSQVQSPSNWSVTSTELQTWLSGGNVANMRWNVAGVSNYYDGSTFADIGLASTNQGQTDWTPDTWGSLYAGLSNAGNYLGLLSNSGVLSTSDSAVVSNNLFPNIGSSANEYNGTFALLQFDNRTNLGTSPTQLFSYLTNLDGFAGTGLPETITQLGSISLLAATGTVSFSASAVPVPAAIWLLGSGLLGLGGVARRRRVAAAA